MSGDEEILRRQEALREELDLPRLPELGDEVFGSGAGGGPTDSPENWGNVACVNWDWSDYGYVEGYKLAGDILVDRIEATHGDQDKLVYPVCFMYRQYLELAMKAINRDGREYLGWPPAEFSGHDLIEEWKQCRQTIEAIFSGPVGTIDAVENYVRQFAAMDKTGMAFRYWLSKKGTPLLPSEVTHINLRQLSDRVDSLHVWFDGIDTGISENLRYKQEAAEYAREAAAEAQDYGS